MKLIESKVEILTQGSGIEGVYKQIELAGRTCYKSEDKITPTSAKEFTDRMIKSNHLAVCEHGTLYFKIPVNIDVAADFLDEVPTWTKCRLVESQEGNWWAITTNLRVMVEHFAPEYIENLIENYLCEPTEFHKKRITVKFICDRGVSHQFVRHRVFSFAQESTRYCNYSKDKFNNELTFIKPTWLDIPTGDYTYWDGDWCDIDNMKIQLPSDGGITDNFLWCLKNADSQYRLLINKGLKSQEARQILPNATKTELVMTGFESDWEHFFELRCSKAAHPDAQKLANELKELIHK